MRKTAFTTIYNAPTSDEAESAIAQLRASGFHPAELALTTTVPFSKSLRPRFPVEVPADEAARAKRAMAVERRGRSSPHKGEM